MRKVCMKLIMRNWGGVCPKSDPYAKKHSTGKYFQGLIYNKLDTPADHKETNLRHFRSLKRKVKQNRLAKQLFSLKKINLPFVCSDLANIYLFSSEKGHYPMNP